jgi:hypothetical protein
MTHLNDDKIRVLEHIQSKVYSDVTHDLLTGVRLNEQAVAGIIARAIRSGFEAYIEQQYTDEDFERDMRLGS